jgi:hypothetical protein
MQSIRNSSWIFWNSSLVHKDVHWRNIGKYKDKNGEDRIVIYDLDSVRSYNKHNDLDWIDKAMEKLYPSVDSE